MKIKTKYLICIIITLTLTVLPACSMFWSSNPDYSGGQILDEELMSSIREEILGEESTTTDENKSDETVREESTTKKDLANSNGTVYWTKSGGVYHFYKDCGYIKSSSEIMSGSAKEAKEAGKTGVCSRCESRQNGE